MWCDVRDLVAIERKAEVTRTPTSDAGHKWHFCDDARFARNFFRSSEFALRVQTFELIIIFEGVRDETRGSYTCGCSAILSQ